MKKEVWEKLDLSHKMTKPHKWILEVERDRNQMLREEEKPHWEQREMAPNTIITDCQTDTESPVSSLSEWHRNVINSIKRHTTTRIVQYLCPRTERHLKYTQIKTTNTQSDLSTQKNGQVCNYHTPSALTQWKSMFWLHIYSCHYLSTSNLSVYSHQRQM